MITAEIELKPCPLCGNRVEITELIRYGDKTTAKIQCRCGLTFEHSRREYTLERRNDHVPNGVEYVPTGIFDEEDFVTAWNRRAKDEHS